MAVGPIPPMHDFTAVKAPAADFQLSAVVEMEAVARPDHSARAAARRKARGAEEIEADDLTTGNEPADSSEELARPHISFFA